MAAAASSSSSLLTAAAVSLLPLLVLYRAYSLAESRRRRASLILGVDIGGSSLKLGIFSINPYVSEKTLRLVMSETNKCSPGDMTPDQLVNQLYSTVSAMLSTLAPAGWTDVGGIGVCMPGRCQDGIVSSIANFPHFPPQVNLAQLIREYTGVQSVHVGNDANAALVGEWTFGVAKGKRDVVLVTLGTGVGASVISNGALLTGSTGMFGEIGHTICHCEPSARLSTATGVRGIMEEYASARSVERTWHELCPHLAYPGLQIVMARESNDARRVVDSLIEQLGVLCINAARCYDPQLICLGGGLCEIMDPHLFLRLVREAVKRHHWTLTTEPTFQVELASLGNHAGMMGAACLV